MKSHRLFGAILAALLLLAPARATEQSTFVMPDTGPHSFADIVDNFLNPGLRTLAACSWGPSAPANGPSSAAILYQCWADTTSNPVLFKRWDGTAWSVWGALDTSAHTWTPYRQGAPIAAVATSSSAADLTTGVLPAARLPSPTASTLGGIQSITSLAHNWIAFIDTFGVAHQSQPSFADISSSLACSQTPALTGDVTTSAGACLTALANIPSGTPAAGSILNTNIAAPSTPAAGKTQTYVDSTAKRFHDKNDAGAVGTTVVGDAGLSHNFLTSIDPSTGAVGKSRPGCADLSDASVFCNGTNAANLTGTVPAGTLPTPGVSTLGAVNSKDCLSLSQFVVKINTDGTVTCGGTSGGGNVNNSGTPVAGQIAQWIDATHIQGIPRATPEICEIISTSATACANGNTQANAGTYTPKTGALYTRFREIGAGGGGGGGGTGSPGTGSAGGNTTISFPLTSISNASPAVFTLAGHGLRVGDRISLTTTGSLLTGLSLLTDYYVIAAGLTASTFEVSTTAGGAAVNTSSAGSGTHSVAFQSIGGGAGSPGAPGAGGAALGCNFSVKGGAGGFENTAGNASTNGGPGGASFFGGSSPGTNTTPQAPAPNSGAGGAGGGSNASSTAGGQGGGAAGYCERIVVWGPATLSYTVGAGGAVGAPGTNGVAGAAGADGRIIAEDFFN